MTAEFFEGLAVGVPLGAVGWALLAWFLPFYWVVGLVTVLAVGLLAVGLVAEYRA